MNWMAKITFGLALFTLLLATTGWCSPRVAVMDFENKAQHGGWRIGRGAADMLATELVKMDSMEIFERDRLSAIIKEQDLGASGRVDASTAAKIGKIIGVQYIVTGAVTEYGDSSSDIGGRGFEVGKIDYKATVDIRLVDTNTGRIVFAETGSGSKLSLNFRAFGFGGRQGFDEKAASESMRKAIKELTDKLSGFDLKSALPKPDPGTETAKALVADVDGKVVTFNKGSGAGFESGQVVSIKRKGKVIKDPATGEVIKVRYNTVGKVKLSEVDANYSEGNIVSGEGFKVGDMVE